MRIVIVGGGVVGYSLAEHLLKERHELSLIELDKGLSEELSHKLDMQIICGSGSSPAMLHAAGLRKADMVLAVTPNDEVNIVVCSIASQFDVPSRIARLRSRDYESGGKLIDLKKLGITDVIHPEQALVDHIIQYITTPHAVEAANFEDGRILLRGYTVTERMELAGKCPKDIRREIAPEVVLFPAIVRRGMGMIPDGDTEIQPGDIVYSLFPRESLERFLQLVGVEKKHNRKIIITGDSYATVELAEALDNTEYKVTLVDPNLEHAQKAAERFKKIVVIHGDCTDSELLRELHIYNASYFIATSEQTDYNMLSALLAKAEGAHETIATTMDTSHDQLYRSIGIDHIINPRLTTAREILEMISRGQIGAVVQLSDVDIEAVRVTVDPDSVVAGVPIAKVANRLKRGSIIGVVIRENRMIIPDGQTVLEADDHLIVVTHHKNLSAVSKLFKPRGMFQ